jgi:DNA repair exonuclease SbcCD ATPase subunit
MEAEIQTVTVKPLATFESTKDELIAFVNGYTNLVVTDETLDEAKKARATLRDKRYDIQRIEKLNTDQLNDLKNQNWENAKKLLAIITPTEETIDKGIKSIEDRKAALKAEKERLAREKVEAEIRAEQERLAKIEAERLAKIDAEQRAEAERLAALQAEIDAKNKAEQERLAKIQAEQERIAKEQAAKDAAIKAEQEKKEAELRAEREKFEAEKRLAELEEAKKLAAERAQKETEARIKREAEEKLEREKLAKLEAERQEALKPDKEKLRLYLSQIGQVITPVLVDESAKRMLGFIQDRINNITTDFNSQLDKL